MILIWKGWGLVTPVIAVVCFLAPSAGLLTVFPDSTWPFGVSLMISGVITFMAGKALNRDRNVNTLYFIPMQYWGVPIALFGLVSLFAGIGGGGSSPDAPGERIVITQKMEEKIKKRVWKAHGRSYEGRMTILYTDRVLVATSEGNKEFMFSELSVQDQEYCRGAIRFARKR